MSRVEESLSSSVELISASPSPERPAPDRTRLLTWHTPRQRRRSSPSPSPPGGQRQDDSDDSLLASGRRRRPGPLLISDDEEPAAAGGPPRHPSVLLISDDDDVVADTPPAAERRRARPPLSSQDESDDSDTIPCSQQRRPGSSATAAAVPAGHSRRSGGATEQSFDEREQSGPRERWGTSAATRDSGRELAGGGADSSAVSAAESNQSSSSCSATTGLSPEEGSAGEDPRARAQRLYSKYTVKKRATPPVEAGQTAHGSSRSPTSDQPDKTSHRGDRNGTPTGGERQKLPTVAGPNRAMNSAGRGGLPAPRQPSQTVIIVPSEPASDGASVAARGGAGTARTSSHTSPNTSADSGTGRPPQAGRAAPQPGGSAGRAAPVSGTAEADKAGTAAGRAAEGADTSDDWMDLSYLSINELEQQLKQKEMVARVSNLSALPDAGRRLRSRIQQLRDALQRKRSAAGRQGEAQHPVTGGPAGGSVSAGGRPAGPSSGASQLQQVQEQIRQKKMLFSTSSHRSDPALGAQLQKDIFRLETEMMRLQMAQSAAGPAGGRNPFTLGGSVVGRPVALNRPRGEPGRPPAPGPDPTASLESALRQGRPTTAVVTEQQRRLEAEARESLRDFGQIRPQLTAALLASNPELSRLYGGRMTEARHRQASNVTSEVLERLHRSLETRPPVSAEEAGPACLNVPLMPHQQYALCWLQWRESQQPAGGILADDMGLGKTLTMIAHCLRFAELERQAAEKAAQDVADKENVRDGGTSPQDGGARTGQKTDAEDGKDGAWLSRNKPAKEDATAPEPSDATLVVCPASVLLQWEAEVKRRTTGGITTIVYHGPNRRADHKRLRKASFVMTTYDLVRQEVEKDSLIGANKSARSPLLSFTWKRIILDEAHQIRNRNTKSSKSVCELHAGRRWLLSGTPIQNGREDLFSLMRFLRASPFHEHEVWKRWIDKSPRGDERLSLIVQAMVLRRTKDQMSPATGKPLVALPPREKLSHTVELEPCEREVYDKVFAFCRSSLQEFIKLQEQREYEKELRTNPLARPPPGLAVTAPTAGPGAPTDVSGDPSGLGQKGSIKQHHLLVQLLRLRQICCHPGLAKTVMTSSDREAAGVDAEEDAADLQQQLMGLSLSETVPAKQASVLSADNPVFSRHWCSSKLRRLMQEVDAIVAAGQEKVVVVSQWTSMLDIVREHLTQARVPSCTISGAVKMSERQELIDAFNGSSGRGPRVMLLSLLAGGVGLNLVGGNHLFIMDPHWNPQLEEQAGDRIYRVGQRRGVFIHRFVCKDTLEERILELQQSKLSVARGVLSGDKQAASHRLTLSDLKTLFNVH